LILECSQGCYGRTDGSVTISLRNFVGEGIIMYIENIIIVLFSYNYLFLLQQLFFSNISSHVIFYTWHDADNLWHLTRQYIDPILSEWSSFLLFL